MASARVELLALQIGIGQGLGRLQTEEHLAFLDALRFLDEDLLNDAAFQMLDGLAIGLHGDARRCDRCAVERRHGAPTGRSRRTPPQWRRSRRRRSRR